MSEEDFRSYYEALTDDQLQEVLADKKDLLPDAAAALDQEVRKRKLEPPEPPQWKPLADTNGTVHCFDDYPEYRALTKRRQLANRYAILIALVPLVLGLAFARRAVENSDTFIILALGWAITVVSYAWSITVRWFGYRCPQCGESFGRGDECFSCGFPRSLKKDSTSSS